MTDEAYGLLMGFGRWLTLDEPSNGASPLASLAESLGALAGDLLVLRGDTGGGSFGPPAPQKGAPPPTLRTPLLFAVSSILRRGGPSGTVASLVGMVRYRSERRVNGTKFGNRKRSPLMTILLFGGSPFAAGDTPSRHRIVSTDRGRRSRSRRQDPRGHSDPYRIHTT